MFAFPGAYSSIRINEGASGWARAVEMQDEIATMAHASIAVAGHGPFGEPPIGCVMKLDAIEDKPRGEAEVMTDARERVDRRGGNPIQIAGRVTETLRLRVAHLRFCLL